MNKAQDPATRMDHNGTVNRDSYCFDRLSGPSQPRRRAAYVTTWLFQVALEHGQHGLKFRLTLGGGAGGHMLAQVAFEQL